MQKIIEKILEALIYVLTLFFIYLLSIQVKSIQASERGNSVRNTRYIELQLRVEKCIPKMLNQQFGFDQAKAICIDIVRSQTLTLKDKKILDHIEAWK